MKTDENGEGGEEIKISMACVILATPGQSFTAWFLAPAQSRAREQSQGGLVVCARLGWEQRGEERVLLSH
jgi:hypothetical protein